MFERKELLNRQLLLVKFSCVIKHIFGGLAVGEKAVVCPLVKVVYGGCDEAHVFSTFNDFGVETIRDEF